MKSSAWLAYYQRNSANRTEPAWGALVLVPESLRVPLSVSLSHFQLGETGGGSFLLREAARHTDPDDLAALEYFVREEKEHARLLACMVRRLGGSLVHRHWTHRVFKLARRAGGFQFEIQMLLTAEIVGTAYYELLSARMEDTALLAALKLMLHDEKGHVAFHLDRLRVRWREFLPLERTAWAGQFQMLALSAIRLAWVDHRVCLRGLGYGWNDFSSRARRGIIGFLDGLERGFSSQESEHPAETIFARG